jgi:signal transduction histidine kinase
MKANPVRQTFRTQLGEALRLPGTPGEVQGQAARLLGEYLDVNRVVHLALDGARLLVRDAYTDDVEPMPASVPFSTYARSIVEANRHGDAAVLCDVANDRDLTDAERDLYGSAHIGASIAVILVRHREDAIIFQVQSVMPRQWSEDEVVLVREVAERIWLAVDRLRSVRTLRESQERLSRAHESLERRVQSQNDTLFKRLISVQAEERRRMARDIHDQLGQQMTALRLSLDAASRQGRSDSERSALDDRSRRLAEDLDRSIDLLASELRPAALDPLGLPGALRNLIVGWSERSGITVQFDADDLDGLRLSRDVETNLYQIAQEALHNVVKHAGAGKVTMLLEHRQRHIILLIEDNGRGFLLPDRREPSDGPPDSHGFGLVSMRERAQLVGGTLDIDTSPGRGTSIYVRVRLPSSTTRRHA